MSKKSTVARWEFLGLLDGVTKELDKKRIGLGTR